MSMIVIDGKLPVAAIVRSIIEAQGNGAGVGIDFADVENAEAKQTEINLIIDGINQQMVRVHADERRRPLYPEGNRAARRAAESVNRRYAKRGFK